MSRHHTMLRLAQVQDQLVFILPGGREAKTVRWLRIVLGEAPSKIFGGHRCLRYMMSCKGPSLEMCALKDGGPWQPLSVFEVLGMAHILPLGFAIVPFYPPLK